MKCDNNIKTFFVTSYGRTATKWLTAIFNVHPEIFCTHGPTLEQLTTNEKVHRKQDEFYALSLDEIINNMRKNEGESCYGNFHAFTASNFYKKLLSENISYPYAWVNLTRHPFTRIESFVQEWEREIQINSFFKKQLEDHIASHSSCQSYIELVRSRYDVDFSDIRNRLFIFSVIQQGTDLPDSQLPCRNIKYEQLVNDIEYFMWFFHYLTKMKMTDELVQSFFEKKGTNSSAIKGKSSFEVIHHWEKWKIMVVRFFLETSPEYATMYRDLNYEIDAIFDIAL